MCLYTLPATTIQTATKPIKVWKMLMTSNKSPYMDRKYEANKMAHADRKLVIQWGGVEHGLHAFVNKDTAIHRFVADSISSGKVVSMTIPVGARYVLGKHGDIVSNRLLTGSLEPVL